jgi:hypothetical protein
MIFVFADLSALGCFHDTHVVVLCQERNYLSVDFNAKGSD